MSRVEDHERVIVPLGWNEEVRNSRLYWSVMTPGTLYDEGFLDIEGAGHDFVWRPRQSNIQMPNYDSVNYGDGSRLLTDIVVFVFFLEGELDGEKVFDATRVVMRGDVIINPDALINPDQLHGAGPYVGDPPSVHATYPGPSYTKDRDLDGLRVQYSEGDPVNPPR